MYGKENGKMKPSVILSVVNMEVEDMRVILKMLNQEKNVIF